MVSSDINILIAYAKYEECHSFFFCQEMKPETLIFSVPHLTAQGNHSHMFAWTLVIYKSIKFHFCNSFLKKLKKSSGHSMLAFSKVCKILK